jgi:hypothetical protein
MIISIAKPLMWNTPRAWSLTLTLAMAVVQPCIGQQEPPQPHVPVPQTHADTQPDAAPATATSLVDAQQVIDQAIEAVGGKAAIDAIESIAIKASLATDRGHVQLELFSAEPDKAFVRRNDVRGETTLGSDGKLGWLKPAGSDYQLLDEMQSDHVQRQSNVYRVLLHIREDYRDFQTVDRPRFDDVEVHKIKMIDHRGKVQFALFDVETRLIKALLIPEDTPEGERIVTVRFQEWKKHGDILGFTKATIENESVSVLTIQQVEFNAVDPQIFEPPDQVKTLREQQSSITTVPSTQPQTSPDEPEEGDAEDEATDDQDDSEEEPDADPDEEARAT